MREMHGLMMDAVGARPEQLGHAPQHPPAPAQAWGPLMHGFGVQTAVARVAQQKSAQAMVASAAWPALLFNSVAWSEALDLAGAIGQQCLALQSLWFEGLRELADDMGQLRSVNTASKLVDQEMNLVQQSLALVASQATATARVGENIQSNLAYWLSQKARQAPRWADGRRPTTATGLP